MDNRNSEIGRWNALAGMTRVMWRREGVAWKLTTAGHSDAGRQDIILTNNEAISFMQAVLKANPEHSLSHDAILAMEAG